MKQIKKYVALFLGLGLLFSGCSNDDDMVPITGIPPGPGLVTLQSEVNEFIWRGMNHWYFWQADQTDLADDRFADTDKFYEYLNGFSSSEDLFNALVFQPDVVDDFSWYIPDVEEQLNSFRGISESYGIGFPRSLISVSPDTDDVIIYIAYVVPNSPAADAGLKRGDIIYQVDGVEMNSSNSSIINNVFTNKTISFGLANIEDGNVVPIPGEISLTAEIITSNPIQHFEVLQEGGKKIGYLVYNAFRSTFNGELNEVFNFFKNEGVDEVILDLRYNGGGSVLSSALLSSMINGSIPANGDTYARLQYNPKRDADSGTTFPFFDDVFLYDKTTSDFTGDEPANRLGNISRLYVLTGRGTASASEMIINGLRPFMPVTLVGETTVGKNEGSITVVDAPANGSGDPFTDLDNRNPDHTVGMQPIVFQVFNNRDESDYTFGFEPDILVEEFRFAADIKPFGDPNEALLRAALDDMLGTATAKFRLEPSTRMSKTSEQLRQPKFTDEMYFSPRELEQ